jgi:ADP-ribosylglycohydrolase
LRFWLLGLPAGIGLATLKGTLKLWLGVPPQRSGVFSAGNGPAMRSVVLGSVIDDLDLLKRLVTASTRITHTDPKADDGAFAVALAVHTAGSGEQPDVVKFTANLRRCLTDAASEEFLALVDRVIASVGSREATEAFAASMGWGKGVSGYIYHTVPVVLHAWLSHPCDFRAAVTSVIRCGGDTDTTAAIVGGIVGSTVGKEGIPKEWLDRLAERPRSVAWMERLGEELASARAAGVSRHPPRLAFVPLILRNLLFIAVVLGHGFRRLLPPY